MDCYGRRRKESIVLFYFVCVFSSLLLDRSIDRLSIIVGGFRCVDGCVVFVFGSIRSCLRMYTVLGVFMSFFFAIFGSNCSLWGFFC